MDALELHVQQARLEQRRQLRARRMDELLEGIETARQLVDRRRDVDGVAGPRAADPVLRAAEFARALRLAAPALHQALVHLADEPQGKREGFQPVEAIHHGIDVVGDFADVVDRLAGGGVRLEAQEIGQGGLGAFDLRGQHRLLADVHVEEERVVGQEEGNAVQTAHRPVGGAQALGKRSKQDRRLGRERRRDEGPVPFVAGDDVLVPAEAVGGWGVHSLLWRVIKDAAAGLIRKAYL